MVLPPVKPGVEEADERSSLRIEGTNIAPLPCIAPDARVCKVIGFRQAAMFSAYDVVRARTRLPSRVGIILRTTPLRGDQAVKSYVSAVKNVKNFNRFTFALTFFTLLTA